MINDRYRRLGAALVRANMMTQAQLDAAIASASKDNTPSLVVSLLETGNLTFKSLEKFMASTQGIQSAIVANRPIIKPLVDLVGIENMNAHFVYPFAERKDGENKTMALGMVDPLDLDVIEYIKRTTGYKVVPVLISLPDFREAMKKNFPPRQVVLDGEKEDFVLVRPGGIEEEIKHAADNQTSTSTDFQTTKTVQPKPGLNAPTGFHINPNMRLTVEMLGRNKPKYREEILAALDLDPVDARFLREPTYTREVLMSHLKNVNPGKLQKLYNDLAPELRVEALANVLIKAGVFTKVDLLISAAVSLAFKEEKKD